MNLQRLEGFYWVARTGGYARAVRAFPYPITAPGIHQQVKRLEADLGLRLFERTGKDRLVRTPAGEKLYELVAPFLERLPAALGQIAGGELRGRVRVRAPALVMRVHLPEWLSRLARVHPGIQVDLDEVGDTDVGMLQRGEADVYIDTLEIVPAGLETLRIDTLRPFVVIPAGHRLARARRRPLEALAGEPFVAYSSGHRARDLQLEALARHGIQPDRIIGASSVDAILSLVSVGLGYSLVPAVAGGPDRDGVASWPMTEPGAEFPMLATWRRSSGDNPLVAAFLAAAPRERAIPGGGAP